jgi:hypothetical protein
MFMVEQRCHAPPIAVKGGLLIGWQEIALGGGANLSD